MKKYMKFEEYMQDKYYDVIIKSIKHIVIQNRDCFEGERYHRVIKVEPSNIAVVGVTFKDFGDDWLEIRTSVSADIDVEGMTEYGFDSSVETKLYNVFFKAILNDGLKHLTVTNTEEYNKPKFDKNTSLSQYLVPYMYEGDVEKEAEAFLQKYFPEALKTPMPLPVEDIAIKMGMEIYYAPMDNTIFGKTYFGPETVTVYDDFFGFNEKQITTKAGTMLINNNVYFMRNVGTANNTIIHECVHWDRHRRSFELQKLLDTGTNHISCEIVESYSGIPSNSSALKWMEWQANQLAPRILMPAEMTKLTLNQLLLDEYRDSPQKRESLRMESAIKKLSEFFGVSLMAAKLRAVELGYEQAQGTNVYCDGKRLPAYSFSQDAIGSNQTFVIDKNNLLFNLCTHPELGKLFVEGKIVYVNCMLCLNTPKYIYYEQDGLPSLTEYAIEHVDECCYAFERNYSISNDYSDTYYRRCFLCRDINSSDFIVADYDPNHKTNQNKSERQRELSKIVAYAEDLEKILGELPGNFSNTLRYHMKRQDINVEELADRSNISTVTISKYRNHNETEKQLGNVLAIGKALGLHPILMKDLINKAGFSDKNDKTSIVINYLIHYQHDESIEEWQKTIDEANLDIKLPIRREN